MSEKIDLNAQLQAERKVVSFDTYDMPVRQLIEMFSRSEIK